MKFIPLIIAFSYWLIDVKKIYVNGSLFFRIVGMNGIASCMGGDIGCRNNHQSFRLGCTMGYVLLVI